MRQTSEFMLENYKADKISFIEMLFNKTTGCCPNLNKGQSGFHCKLSHLYINKANIECEKYWVSYNKLIKGIVDLCGSPVTNKSMENAEVVLRNMWKDDFIIEKKCKRRSSGGPIGWILDGSVSFQYWLFNIEKIGN